MGLIINERRKTSGFSDTMTAVQTALGAVADLALCMGSSSFFFIGTGPSYRVHNPLLQSVE